MRFNQHSPYHWLVVAVVAVVALFTFGGAHGKGATASEARWSVSAPALGGFDTTGNASN